MDTAPRLRPGRGCVGSANRRRTATTEYLWVPESDPLDCTALPTEARGVTTRYEYDAAGNLARVTDPSGRVTGASYDAAHRLAAVVDAAGNTVTYVRDAAGNLIREVDEEQAPDGSSTEVESRFAYDALDRLVSMIDGAGNEWRRTYDARGNLLLSIDPKGYFTENVYDGLDRLLSTTRPEGIRVEMEYDDASRPVVYRDALGNETTWSYDELGRVTAQTFADATSISYQYDAAGNPVQITDPRGTMVAQSFDELNRPISRSVTPSAGVEGALSASFGYDDLGNLVSAEDGAVTTTLEHDSLARLLSDTTAGRTVGYSYDDLGNLTGLAYPSGRVVGLQLDELYRPETIGTASLLPADGGAASIVQRFARYGYRGPSLVAEKDLGPAASPALTGRYSYDPARRLVEKVLERASGAAAFDEALTWTSRGLRESSERRDLNGVGLEYVYDRAGRLVEAHRAGGRGPAAPQPVLWSFSYDAAENLLERRRESADGAEVTALPLDVSGRNRPASVDGVDLVYDAAGNLVQKGDLHLHYDWANRLVRVSDGTGATVASYVYDAFNRRVRREVGGEVHESVWAGLRPVEEYLDGVLAERRTYGLGLDEIVHSERDTDGDGQPDAHYYPVYDSQGNLAMVVDDEGVVIERYDYSPFGSRTITVNDRAPPEVEQIRVEADSLVLELSEEIRLSALQQALLDGRVALSETSGGTPVALDLDGGQLVQQGRNARRSIVLKPSSPPAAGTALHLSVAAGVWEDLFGNADPSGFEQDLSWTAGVVADTAAPELLAVSLDALHLRLTFSEPVDAATLAAVTLDGAALTWSSEAHGSVLTSVDELAPGGHTLSLDTALLDLAGTALGAVFSDTFEVAALQPDRSIFQAPDPWQVSVSTVGNRFGFSGLPLDPETGLVYARNRYYDPELGRFVSVDPLGFADGPNPYVYGLNDPANHSDPLGLFSNPLGALDDLRRLANPLGASGDGESDGITLDEAVDWGVSFARGFGRGAKDAVADFGKSLVGTAIDFVRDPRGQLRELGENLDYLVHHPEVILKAGVQKAREAIDVLSSGDPEAMGELVGRAAANVGIIYLTGKVAIELPVRGTGRLGRLGRWAERSAERAQGLTRRVFERSSLRIEEAKGALKRLLTRGEGAAGRVRDFPNHGLEFLDDGLWTVEPHVPRAAAGAARQLPFAEGDVIFRELQTSQGLLDVAAEVRIQGGTLHLKDIAVYPRGAESLTLGPREVLALRNQLAREAAGLGFDELRITGTRLTGANPGKQPDLLIDLTNYR